MWEWNVGFSNVFDSFDNICVEELIDEEAYEWWDGFIEWFEKEVN